MFLIDSLFNYRSTEPIWFRFFRSVFAIAFTTILLFYSWMQFVKLDTVTYITAKYGDLASSKINASICTGISNEINIVEIVSSYETEINNRTSHCLSVEFSSFSYSFIPIWLNINLTVPFNTSNDMQEKYNNDYMNDYLFYPYELSPFNISNNQLLLSFDSFNVSNTIKKDPIFFNRTRRMEDNYQISLEQYYISPYPGQMALIYVKPIIISTRTSFGDYEHRLYLNPQLEHFPINLEPNQFRIGILSHSDTIEIRKEDIYDYTDLISNLGGFYGGIAGIFVLLFGMPKHDPWGITQKYILHCVPCRKSFTRNLASKYISTAGIPLVDKVKRPEESSSALKALEERVQYLETLLNDYYIEDYYLNQVKKDKTQQKKISDYLQQFEKDKTQQKNFFDYYYYLKQAKARQKKITDYL